MKKGIDIPVSNLTPREIVSELDKFIISQEKAKKTVAIALRNRWRRNKIENLKLKEEIMPKNILMSGHTGVGKTEIARRLAQIADAPFIKVEATKFTEVGYVGRDAESMIKDLVKTAINLRKKKEIEKVKELAQNIAEEKILDLLNIPSANDLSENEDSYEEKKKRREEYRRKMITKFYDGDFDGQSVTVSFEDKNIPVLEISAVTGMEDMDMNLKEMMGNLFPSQKKQKKMNIEDAFEFIKEQEAQKMIDMEKIQIEALKWTEESGIIFIDEIDKIVGKNGTHGPDVSREGVQRDILPIVEGCTVSTKYGTVKTDHILFIAAGAFHMSSPTDLIPELQGRFPLTVELLPLSKNDFEKILTDTEHSLVKQYIELLKTENTEIHFSKDGIKEIAKISFEMNNSTQDIGARRLQMVIETILEDLSFSAPDKKNQKINIDAKFVQKFFKIDNKKEKLSNYIL